MTSLTHFNKAKQELALATKIDEVKEIRDKAEALRFYAKQQGESLEMQNNCAEIKIRAERRAGEILKETELNKGGRPSKNRSSDSTSLSDIGINKDQSSTWQRIADIPKEEFESHVTEKKEAKQELTTAGLVKVAKSKEREAKREKIVEEIVETAELTGKYSVILADPPWRLQDHHIHRGRRFRSRRRDHQLEHSARRVRQ